MTVTPRLHRLLAADGKCFDVAIDHGFFNEGRFLSGITDMGQAVETVVRAAPDAVQLSPGMARLLQDLPGPKPALVLRTDIANVYGAALPRTLFSDLIERAVEQALALDAACVVANVFLIPDQPEVYRDCLRNVARLKPECQRTGMPLMVEPLVMKGGGGGGYDVDGDLEKIVPLVRQAVELGADLIKADPCEHLEEYHRVIEVAAGIPVLVRGGGRATDAEILARTRLVMDQGASGIVYGRNVIQHQRPDLMVRALMAVVHEGASAQAAGELLGVHA